MNDPPNKIKDRDIEEDIEERPPQFTIRKIMLWTAFVGGGLTFVSVDVFDFSSFLQELAPVVNLSLYLVFAGGLWRFVQSPKGFEVWFPVAMSIAAPFSLPFAYENKGVSVLPLLLSVFYGIYLLTLNMRQKNSRGFSLTLFVFHVGCWLWWMACAAVAWIGAMGGFE